MVLEQGRISFQKLLARQLAIDPKCRTQPGFGWARSKKVLFEGPSNMMVGPFIFPFWGAVRCLQHFKKNTFYCPGGAPVLVWGPVVWKLAFSQLTCLRPNPNHQVMVVGPVLQPKKPCKWQVKGQTTPLSDFDTPYKPSNN